MGYTITVVTTVRIEKRSLGKPEALVSEVKIPVVRTNGAPNETYVVHDVEAAATEAVDKVVGLVAHVHGRSKRPDWECS